MLQSFKKLKYLGIAFNEIDKEIMNNEEYFVADLLILDLFSTNFEDEGVEKVIKKFTKLTHLNIGNTEITDKTIELIFQTD